MLEHMGLRIKELRESQGLSRERLAALICKAGTTTCTAAYLGAVERFEERYRNPTIEKIVGIAQGLGVHPFYLLDGNFGISPPQKSPPIAIEPYLKMPIGERVRAIREWRGWSVKELAKKCDLSAPALEGIEAAESLPLVTFYRLALELRIPHYWLTPEPLKKERVSDPKKAKLVDEIRALLDAATPEHLRLVRDLLKSLASAG